MFYWKCLTPGAHQARRDGNIVATAERYDDAGRPRWRLAVLDGTPMPPDTRDSFVTLGAAKFAYGRAYRMASAS